MSRQTKILAIVTLLSTLLILGIVSALTKTQPPVKHPPLGTSIHHDPAPDAGAAKDYGKSITFDPNPYAGVHIKQVDLVIQEPIAFELKEGEYTILGTIAPGPRVSMNCWTDQCILNIDKDMSGALIGKEADRALMKAMAEEHTLFFSLGTNGYTIYDQRPHAVDAKK